MCGVEASRGHGVTRDLDYGADMCGATVPDLFGSRDWVSMNGAGVVRVGAGGGAQLGRGGGGAQVSFPCAPVPQRLPTPPVPVLGQRVGDCWCRGLWGVG